jgi:large subunit ribosomal protein L9
MEIILKIDVENLGFKDDVVSVKNGYGRNFLIPQKMAVLATPSAKKVLAENIRQKAHREAKVLDDAKKIAAALETMSIKISAKTADGSKLFGSITSADIAAAFAAQGTELENKFIKLDGNSVKRIGKYVAHVRLHRSLVVDVPFEVIPENTNKSKVETAVKVENETDNNTAE